MKEKDVPGVIARPPFIYLGALLLGIILHFIFPIKFLSVRFLPLSGLIFIVIGIFILRSGFKALNRADTHRSPYKPTTAIVMEGSYRISRNPLYLGLTLIYLGLAILLNMLLVLLLLPIVLVVMHFGVIIREEKYLERKFGKEYLRYKSKVRRWL